MRIFLAILFLLLTTHSFATVIKSIEYNGMVHMSEPVALRMLEFSVGDDVDEVMINKAIKKYFEQGYFNDAWAEIKGTTLVFYFKEKAVISQVELKGWKEDEEDIKESVVQIKKGSLYNERKLEDAKKRIISAINAKGKIDSVVEVETEYLANGSMKVTFLVSEGEEITIENLKYSGVSGLESDGFDSVIANKEHEWMGWFWGRNDGKMSLGDLEYDNLRIRDYYMQYGYLDSKVDAPFVRVNFNHYTADMSYQIEEGAVYSISGISIEQMKKVIGDEKI
ncbi:MAG: POTRA domain-containing protein, partial [Sulfurimonas sp.]